MYRIKSEISGQAALEKAEAWLKKKKKKKCNFNKTAYPKVGFKIDGCSLKME